MTIFGNWRTWPLRSLANALSERDTRDEGMDVGLKEKQPQALSLLGIPVGHLPQFVQLLICVGGVFFFHICHGYLQVLPPYVSCTRRLPCWPRLAHGWRGHGPRRKRYSRFRVTNTACSSRSSSCWRSCSSPSPASTSSLMSEGSSLPFVESKPRLCVFVCVSLYFKTEAFLGFVLLCAAS